MSKLYMVANTHFDPVWLWTWDEAMASIRATFRSALDRMNEDEDFVYSFATPPVFEWIRKTDPELFSEIKVRIYEGRWELNEGWWVQPDCFGACGESYVRQGLYGQKYLEENFGKRAASVFNIDSFGHSPALPQILRKSRFKNYCFVRPEKHHVPLAADLFIWQSADGSEIPTYRAYDSYSDDLEQRLDNADKETDELIVYGVTDHGGAPTKKMISLIHNRENTEFSTVSRFFAEHKNIKNIYRGELLTGDFGVYANAPLIKRMNRTAEYAVLNAEKASLIAGTYDTEKLEECWHDILFDQFHDILGGACIKRAYTDAENTFGRAAATAEEIMHTSLQSYTRMIRTPGKNPDDIWNLVIWNLNGCKFSNYLEAEVQWAHEFTWYDKGIALEDEDGNRYPCQVIPARSVIPQFRSRFVFKADIPSVGYKAFKVVKTGEDESKRSADIHKFTTDRLEVLFSAENGCISSVTDRENGRVLSGRMLCPVCRYDDGDTWAFNIDSYADKKEFFEYIKTEVVECGKLRTKLKATYKYRNSLLEMYYTFYENERYFDVHYRVNWNEKHVVLKLECDNDTAQHTAALPYSNVQRGETAADVPFSGWIKCSNFSLAADTMFAYNMQDETLALTVLRSPIYGDLRMSEINYDDDFDILSQGITEGNVRIDYNIGTQEAFECFANKPIIIDEANHDGTKPCCAEFCSVSGKDVIVSAIKKCEYDGGIVVRLFSYGDTSQTAELMLAGKTYRINIGKYEIKSLKISDGKIKEIYMTEDD